MAGLCGPLSMNSFIADSVVQTVRVQNVLWLSRNNETAMLPRAFLACREERTA
jgi:hypothetical protein